MFKYHARSSTAMSEEKSTPHPSDISRDFRGVWTPPVPLIVVALLILAIGIGGFYVSLSSVAPFDTERQLDAASNTSLVMEGESVRITVREANTDEPVAGAKITVEGAKTHLVSSPVLWTDDSGRATVNFGRSTEGVAVDWSPGKDRVTVEFVATADTTGVVGQQSRVEVTVIRP